MLARRQSRRPIRRLCLDLAHTDPDSPCPYCTPAPGDDPVIALVLRRHAELAAEDAEGFGWAA
jgi:hypothetical protein